VNGIANSMSVAMQDFQWTAVFFAVQERRAMVLDYLLRTGRVDVTHKDDVRCVDLVLLVTPS
jgi:hypothetical protein